jgi:hypothetical protein
MKKARGAKSAKWLSDQTDALGYRVSPTVIAKLDSGHRGSVLSVAELLVLAAALEVPPGLLLFPDYPDGHVELLPGRDAESRYAVKWLSGLIPPKKLDNGAIEIGPSNPGVDLVEAVEERDELDRSLFQLRLMERAKNAPADATESVKRMIEIREVELASVDAKITRAKAALWGTPIEGESDG